MADKKSFALRLNSELFDALQRIAEQEFRSMNGQIEAVLTDYVRRRLKSSEPGEPLGSTDES
jgi:hypothetical protein